MIFCFSVIISPISTNFEYPHPYHTFLHTSPANYVHASLHHACSAAPTRARVLLVERLLRTRVIIVKRTLHCRSKNTANGFDWFKKIRIWYWHLKRLGSSIFQLSMASIHYCIIETTSGLNIQMTNSLMKSWGVCFSSIPTSRDGMGSKSVHCHLKWLWRLLFHKKSKVCALSIQSSWIAQFSTWGKMVRTFPWKISRNSKIFEFSKSEPFNWKLMKL